MHDIFGSLFVLVWFALGSFVSIGSKEYRSHIIRRSYNKIMLLSLSFAMDTNIKTTRRKNLQQTASFITDESYIQPPPLIIIIIIRRDEIAPRTTAVLFYPSSTTKNNHSTTQQHRASVIISRIAATPTIHDA